MTVVETRPVTSSERRAFWWWIAAHAIGAVALAWIALVNGYPLIFSDSGSYIAVGTELEYLSDRPVRDRKSTRLNSSHSDRSRMPSSA